jgi:ribonucleoside-diphosphate reductase alpha chain
LVEAASRRQKWIDQAQSLNLYIADANGKKLDVTYRMAWLRGLKTTYYLRALSATSTEKSTVAAGKLNAVSAQMLAPAIDTAAEPKACLIDNPECEACQ